jgi:hypothetical protein
MNIRARLTRVAICLEGALPELEAAVPHSRAQGPKGTCRVSNSQLSFIGTRAPRCEFGISVRTERHGNRAGFCLIPLSRPNGIDLSRSATIGGI